MIKYFLLSIFFSVFLLADSGYSQISDVPPFTGDTAGVVNGRPILRKDYVDMFKIISGQMMQKKKGSLTGPEILDAHRKTWDAIVGADILDDSIQKKGITTTDAEVFSMLEKTPPDFLKQAFMDSSGKFQREIYLKALHDPKNDSIIYALTVSLKPEIRREKLSKMLLAGVTVSDDELWNEYKDKKGATRKKFESEKENLKKKKLQEKQAVYLSNWFTTAKANARIIDYRTIK